MTVPRHRALRGAGGRWSECESRQDRGRDPGEQATVDASTPDDVWGDSRSVDVPSNHAAQINRLVEDLLAGRPHETTLSAVRPTMELVTALYASSLTGSTVHRSDLVPGHPHYARLDGGLSADAVTATTTANARRIFNKLVAR